MPYVRIEILEGRAKVETRELASAVTDAVCTSLHCDPQTVWVVIDERNAENWAIAGQVLSEKER